MQNLNNPISRLGIIPGKAQPDWYQIRQGQANAEDPTLAGECYAGGSKEINHDIMPGDLSFGRKCVRNNAQAPGEPNEVGIVSLAGVWHPKTESHRSLEDQYYPQGVVVTECRVSDPMGNPGAQDPDSGYAMVKAGTISIINNGPHAFYAGQLIAYRFPSLYKEGYAMEIRQRARGGTIPGQIKPEVVPFDYTDSTIQLQGAIMGVSLTQDMGGVSDMDFAEFFAPDGYNLEDAPTYSAETESAAALKYGVASIVLGALEHLVGKGIVALNFDKATSTKLEAPSTHVDLDATQLEPLMQAASTYLGVFESRSKAAAKPTQLVELIEHIFKHEMLRDAPSNRVGEVVGRLHKGDNDVNRYKKLRQSGGQFFSTFSHGAWNSKTGKVLGRALSYAATSDTLHGMFGHTIV